MGKASLFLFVTFSFFSCVTNTLESNKDCEQYIAVIQSEWVQSEQGIYRYEKHPQYWPPHANFFSGSCLEGLSRKKVISLLGTPSKSFFLNSTEVMIYCTDENCLYGGLESNRGLTVTIDSRSNQVIEAFQNPAKEEQTY
jgi:hypothetical protein